MEETMTMREIPSSVTIMQPCSHPRMTKSRQNYLPYDEVMLILPGNFAIIFWLAIDLFTIFAMAMDYAHASVKMEDEIFNSMFYLL